LLPRGGSRTARFISGHYPSARVFDLVKPLTGTQLYLDTSDPFQADIAYGAYQPTLIAQIFLMARPGDVVFTAGAHLGYVALALAKAVGPAGRVVAFEADSRMAELCRRNLALNNAGSTVTLVPVALGSNNGELEMSVSSTPGQSSFAIGHHMIAKESVAVRKGDEVLADLGITHVDGMVLDVEGWEMEVLAGLSKTLSSHLPRWAIVECWDQALRLAGSSGDELVQKLNTLGWTTTAIDGGPIRDGIDIVCSRDDKSRVQSLESQSGSLNHSKLET
jgi:FkbM family methyltransferase